MSAWNAVSTQTICGRSMLARAASSSASAGGTCSGASSIAASSCCRTVIVDERCVPDRRAAVHKPVGDGVDVARPCSELAQRGDRIGVAVRLLLVLDRVVVADDAQLQAARAGVDGEDAHRSGRCAGEHPARSSRPAPVADLGHVLEVLADVVVMAARAVSRRTVRASSAPAGVRRALRSASMTRW